MCKVSHTAQSVIQPFCGKIQDFQFWGQPLPSTSVCRPLQWRASTDRQRLYFPLIWSYDASYSLVGGQAIHTISVRRVYSNEVLSSWDVRVSTSLRLVHGQLRCISMLGGNRTACRAFRFDHFAGHWRVLQGIARYCRAFMFDHCRVLQGIARYCRVSKLDHFAGHCRVSHGKQGI